MNKIGSKFISIGLGVALLTCHFTVMAAETVRVRSVSANPTVREQQLNAVDAGDGYLTRQGRRKLERLAGALAVEVPDAAAVVRITQAGGALAGYELDEARTGGMTRIKILRASKDERDRQLANPQRINQQIRGARAAAGVASARPVFVDPRSGLFQIPTEEIIVRLKPGIDAPTYFGNDWPNTRSFLGSSDQFIVRLPGRTAEQMLAESDRHMQDNRVLWAEPNFISQVVSTALPDDQYFGRQWHLLHNGQLAGQNGNTSGQSGADINVANAWNFTTGSTNIIVAVLDDGVQLNHPDLAPNLATNRNEIPGNGVDDDGNGYIDDVVGWDFTVAGYGANANPKSADDNHGTSVSGLAVARGNNAVGVAGVAFTSRLLPIRSLGPIALDQMAAAFYYAGGINAGGVTTWRGADVLNLSFGGPPAEITDTALLLVAIKGRGGLGCPIFASAGNSSDSWQAVEFHGFGNGEHTFRCEFNKTSQNPAGQNAVWLGDVQFPGSHYEHFDGGVLPLGWTTDATSPWTVDSSPGFTFGAVKGALRSGTNSSGLLNWVQFTWTNTVNFTGRGFVTYRTSTAPGDEIRIYIDYPTLALSDSGVADDHMGIAYPASHPAVISVGSTTDYNLRSDYSQFGTNLTLVAPGGGGRNGTFTTDRTGTDGYQTSMLTLAYQHPDCNEWFNGTSAAAPIASGVGALVLSMNTNLSGFDVREILTSTGVKIGNEPYVNGRNDFFGYGKVDASAAVLAAPGYSVLPPDTQQRTLTRSLDLIGISPSIGTNQGNTSLEIFYGGTLTNAGGTIGLNGVASANRVSVSGTNSRWVNTSLLTIGNRGSGNQLLATDGALVVSAGAILGSSAAPFSDNNLAVVSGPGSLWTNTSTLTIGSAGRANQLLVTDGGTVVSSNTIVGSNPSSTNNRVLVDGGTLRGPLEIRRGTNVLNAGLIDAATLRVSFSAGRFEFNGGSLASGGSTVTNGLPFIVGNGTSLAQFTLTGNALHTFNAGITLRPNSTLAGSGTVSGVLTLQPGATLTPGVPQGGTGTLVLSNSPVLLGSIAMDLSKNGSTLTNDRIQVITPLTYGGTLAVAHQGPTALANGDSFKLFNGSSYAGAFSSITLPNLPAGLMWTNQLLANGTIAVVPQNFTNLVWYRCGENDPGADNDGVAASTINSLGGQMNLAFGPNGGPRYTNNVDVAAASSVGSTLALKFATGNFGTNTLLPGLTNNFGIELWVKPDNTSSEMCLAYNGNPLISGWGLYLHNGQFQALFGGQGYFGSSLPTPGVWTHLALVRNNGTATLYVNGVPSGTSSTSPIPPTGGFAVAARPQDTSQDRFAGALDEVRVFSFAPGGFSTDSLLFKPSNAAFSFANIAYWRMGDNDPGLFNPGAATSTSDSVGGRSMTLTSQPFYDLGVSSAAATYTGSQWCMRFFTGAYGTALLIPTLTNNFGVELWVKPGGTASNQCLFYNGTTTNNGWGLYLNGNKYQGVIGGVNVVGSATATAGTWTHLALVRDNGTSTLYVNGVASGTLAGAPNPPVGNLALAARPENTTLDRFDGYIDEVRVFVFPSGYFTTNGLLLYQGVVTTTADSGPGSLRQVITDVNAGYVKVPITFNVTNTISLNSDLPAFQPPVTISGPGTNLLTISGNNSSRIFRFSANTTNRLSGLKLANAYTAISSGAALYNLGNTIMNDCALVSNTVVGGFGGAMANFGNGTLSATNCIFANNTVRGGAGENTPPDSGGGAGGGGAGMGGAIYSEGALVTLSGCIFRTNIAAGGIGGNGGINPPTINNGGNGGYPNAGSGGTPYQIGATGGFGGGGGGGGWRGNGGLGGFGGGGGGGGGENQGPGLGGSFGGSGGAGNSLSQYGGGGGGAGLGGALFARAGTVSVLGCTFTGNSATNGLGGASGTTPAAHGQGVGGALFILDALVNLVSPTFSGNTASTAQSNVGGPTTVLNTSDAGSGSLRQAVRNANVLSPPGAITFAPGLSGQTITLTSGQLTLANNMTIDASSLPAGIQISGNNSSRVMAISPSNTVTLESLTLKNGYVTGGSVVGDGAGIYVDSGAAVTLNRSTISGNVATRGGGIYTFQATLTVNSSTLASNSAQGQPVLGGTGGGHYANQSIVAINQSTISGNTVAPGTIAGGGGIGGAASVVTLQNSIVAGNTTPDLQSFGWTLLGSNNLTNGNPLLAPLDNYGGSTQTMPPLAGSPATDGCVGGTAFATDQRGYPRVLGQLADIGAVEGVFNPEFPLVDLTQQSDGNVQFGFTNLGGLPFTVLASTNVAAPLNTWSNLGLAVEAPPGIFTFTDLQATNFPQRFYRVQRP